MRFELLASLPDRPTRILRGVRTLLYRSASPFDSAARRLLGAHMLPPLWLRRHTGPTGDFVPAAREMAATIRRLSLLDPADLVVDVGCGCGAMAVEFAHLLGPGGRYVGFDVHTPSVAWCRRAFAPDRRFRFEIARLDTPFSPGSSGRVEDYVFPVGDAEAGFVLAKSVFTHLTEPESRRYFQEVRRILRPGRNALVTAFLFDPAAPTPAFPFSEETSRMRWKVRVRPHAGLAYARSTFEGMALDAGLKVADVLPRFWPGSAPVPAGQDIVLLSPA